MKKYFFLLLLSGATLIAYGQRNADYGLLGGVSSYIGDINPTRIFYSPLPAGGIFYRYNLHPRQSLRMNLLFGGIRADDLDFDNSFQQNRAASFSGSFGEFSAQFEFNFFQYTTFGKTMDYTPYLALGAGVAVLNSEEFSYAPVIPISIGFKINIYKNLGLEAEYGFRKTFYDNFDGLKDFIDPADHGWLHNNDWYTFAGIALTWKMYNRLAGCPAYYDVDSKRK
jgi:hypothetical protein